MSEPTFTATIRMGNAAFDDPTELARILRAVADAAADAPDPSSGVHTQTIRDVNGNRVGGWKIAEGEA